MVTTYTATYSPDDNKLRLYTSTRLDAEMYARVKAAGFKWAPKQDLFVAPMWTPDRADLLLELAGEIGDEDTSLTDRAEARAERFSEYQEHRAADAEDARRAVAAVAEGVPMGQPILVGHHSERHARRDAERIENGMRRAVRLWDTSEYWRRRAAGAIRHAKYKELPAVRARRIKTIEADKRRQERQIATSRATLALWSQLDDPYKDGRPCDDALRLLRARQIANRYDHGYAERHHVHPSGYVGPLSFYDALKDDPPLRTPAEIRATAERGHSAIIERCERWIQHFDFRLEYERAMLAEAGGTVAQRTGPEQGGACQCWATARGRNRWSTIQKVNRASVTVLDNWGNGGRDFTRTIPFDALREQLRAGVQVIAAPQLFPTPADVARHVIDLADIRPGHRVLEPSAGMGALLAAMGSRMFGSDVKYGRVHAVEIHGALCPRLRETFPLTVVHQADFLTMTVDDFGGTFDRIAMNPPFRHGEDIRHIEHARGMLAAGGRLVAICANGPRQRAALQPDADAWIDLPPGSFAEAGTDVSAAIVVFTAEPIARDLLSLAETGDDHARNG